MIKFVDITKSDNNISSEIEKSIQNNIKNGDFINGKDKKLFEEEFASYIGTKYCIGVGNGSDALEIAIKSLEIEENSEIITHPNSFISTTLAIVNNKHIPIFVDIDENTLMIDVDKIEEKITRKTKALCMAHLFGSSPNMVKIMYIVKKYGLYLIEDCAQSHGSSYNGQKSGTFGDISCFSFYPSKNLGCYGDGGAICTNNQKLYNNICLLKKLGSYEKYYYSIKGRNTNLDNIQAGILRIKLKKLDENNEARREIVNIYKNELKECEGILIPTINDNCESVWHFFMIRVLNNKRNEMTEYLRNANIETNIHYPVPIHKQESFNEYSCESYPICEIMSSQILSLPLYVGLTKDEIIYVSNKIKEFYTQ
jgi:dTDP-4-amino-4,6-dideoxygalactose transaminase